MPAPNTPDTSTLDEVTKEHAAMRAALRKIIAAKGISASTTKTHIARAVLATLAAPEGS